MDLGVDREAAVVESFDQVGFPQRAVAVEQRSVQPRRQLQQFANPARRRQRRAAQVVLHVEIAVEGPGEVGDTAQEFGGVLTEGPADVIADDQILIDVPDVLGSGARRRLEDLQSGDVHRMLT